VAVPTHHVDLTADRPVSAISGDPVERRRDERRQVVSELIDNQPDEVAELLRGWLGDRRSVRR
jgi:flagellar biosynthesis/type III secretory pathway M-ring protein FliF/YscJ